MMGRHRLIFPAVTFMRLDDRHEDEYETLRQPVGPILQSLDAIESTFCAAKYKHDAPASVFPVFDRLADVRLRRFLGHTRWRVVLV